MTLRNIATLFILTLLLAACAGSASTDAPTNVPVVETEIPVIEAALKQLRAK
jgi:ABC-type glycerol-3-phosphate transport system substrate-binding protein